MDKSVFRSFEHFWDEELLGYWERNPERKMNKERFSDVFTPVWGKCMTIANIINGFRATGIWPLNKNAIPIHAYAPSLPTQINNTEGNSLRTDRVANTSFAQDDDSDSDPEDNRPLIELRKKIVELRKNKETIDKNSFSEILITPDIKPKKIISRKKAINYKAQMVTKQLFQKEQEALPSCSYKNLTKVTSEYPKNVKKTESWYCALCKEDRVAHMRKCSSCDKWLHEDCLGLTPEDPNDVTCADCAV